jgi:hypothetical protein
MSFRISNLSKNLVFPKAGMCLRMNNLHFSPKPESGILGKPVENRRDRCRVSAIAGPRRRDRRSCRPTLSHVRPTLSHSWRERRAAAVGSLRPRAAWGPRNIAIPAPQIRHTPLRTVCGTGAVCARSPANPLARSHSRDGGDLSQTSVPRAPSPCTGGWRSLVWTVIERTQHAAPQP